VAAAMPAFAQVAKTLDRPWQPVVVDANSFPQLHATPVAHLHLFAYHSQQAGGVWEPIPFQIDEKDSTDFFTFPHNQLFDGFDQLVFMVRDLGDQAPPEAWIDDVESRSHPRLAIEVADAADPTQRAWAYLYVSSAITTPAPDPYGASWHWVGPDSEWVETSSYAVGFAPSGLIGDARIKPEGGGSGVHLVDTQKLRMVGYFRYDGLAFNLGKSGNPPGNERDFFRRVPDSTRVLAGAVRIVVREWVGLVLLGWQLPVGFPLTTYFYPHSVSFGGAIDSVNLPPDVEIRLDLVRQSLDLTPHASGMRFYNAYNPEGVLVDGVPDTPVSTVEAPGLNWAMVTGEQGTIVTVTKVPRLGSQQGLYYWDNAAGGSADGTHEYLLGGDTGDGVSYGDFGYVFTGETFPVALSFELTCYFLPAYQSPAVAGALKEWVETGMAVNVQAQSYLSGVAAGQADRVPSAWALHQNYPNPFNPVTRLQVELPARASAELQIVDGTGHQVRRFRLSGAGGSRQEVEWDGRDEGGAELPSGVYLAVLRTEGGTLVRKMLLLR
jgi:hypothetical protein